MGRVCKEYVHFPATCECGTHLFSLGDVLFDVIETVHGNCRGTTDACNVLLCPTEKHSQLHVYSSVCIFDDDVCFPIPKLTCPTIDVHCKNCLRHIGSKFKNLFVLHT